MPTTVGISNDFARIVACEVTPPVEVLVIDQRQVGERQLLGHEHAVLVEGTLRLGDTEQVPQDAEAHVLQVDDSVAQIAVRHARELLDVVLDDVLERRLGGEPLRDGGLDLREEAAVLEHEAVRVHDRGVELR
jgi:hypothetical protein